MSLLVAQKSLSTFFKIGLTDKIFKLRYFSYKNILEVEMIDWDEKMSNIIQSLKKIYEAQTTSFLSNHFVW